MLKKPLKKLQYEIHLAEHCNLNCQMCDHFSPLAEKAFLSPASYEKDVTRLGTLFAHQAAYIRLLGGEPLLHPDVTRFFQLTRAHFPTAPLQLYTNGVLLPKQSPDFWEACRTYSVIVTVTKYPVHFDYAEVDALAQKHKVTLVYTSEGGELVKTSWRLPLDLTGSQNPAMNFKKCDMGNVCVFLKNGRLYPCTVAPNAIHFERYFHQGLQVSDADGVDIYHTSADNILRFLSQPIPFCRYCDIDRRQEKIPWALSQQNIQEWT